MSIIYFQLFGPRIVSVAKNLQTFSDRQTFRYLQELRKLSKPLDTSKS